MKNLANELFEIGFPVGTVRMLIDMIQVAQLSDGRAVDCPFDWTPPARSSPQTMPSDLDGDQMAVIVQSLMNLKMTHSEISMFIHHSRSVLVFSDQIRKLIKKPVVH